MRFGLDVPVGGAYADPWLLARMAAEAERAGWDGFFVQDVLNSAEPIADPWICLAAVALQTRRLRLGVMLTPLSRRRPWQVARQAATIDHLSGGRLVLGAGLGFTADDFVPFGEEWDPRLRAGRLDEALEIVTGLWTGGPFSFTGAHYRLDQVTIGPAPVQRPRIPVWVAAGWPHRRPLARAARWDGVYLMTVHQRTGQLLSPSDVAEVVAAVAALRRAGRDDFDVAFNAIPSADPATTARQVRDLAEAGGTWWIEFAPEPTDGGPDRYRERIRRGPPAP